MTDLSTSLKTSNWNLLGHTWAVDMLRQHVANGTARHAYLFTGPPGLGRRTLALRLAQALNCIQPPAPGEFCGACRECRQIAAMQHPDLAVVQAESEGGTLKVDQVREVQRSLALKPYQSKYRVALFLRFQEANPNAANALLKTLEEAPPHVILLLTADNAEQLLPTIVSRCEILRLRPLPVTEVEVHLKSQGTDEAMARLLAHLSGGRPGAALNLVADRSALDFRSERLDDLLSLLPASRVDKFAYAEKLAKDKDSLRQTLLIWQSFWRDVMLAASGASAALTNIDCESAVQKLAGRLDLPQARRLVVEMEKAVERLDGNVNARLLGEVLLMDWPKIT
jgi:DNA polymerase-3 subunit delta'